MAADYAKVVHRFWTGRTGRELRRAGPEAQVVALYLLTCSHRSPFGLYYLPLETLASETGRDLQGAYSTLRKVAATGFAAYDEAAEVVWVPEMAGIQVADSLSPKDNRVSWVRKECNDLRKLPFYQDFLDKWGEAFHCFDIKPLPRPLQAPSETLISPCEASNSSIPVTVASQPEENRSVEGESPRGGTCEKPPSKPKRTTSRRSVYPTEGPDSEPNQSVIDLAKQLGVNLAVEMPKMRDHHTSKGTLMSDWQAARRTWVRNAATFASRPTGNGRQAREDPRLGASSPAARNFFPQAPRDELKPATPVQMQQFREIVGRPMPGSQASPRCPTHTHQQLRDGLCPICVAKRQEAPDVH